MKSVVPINYNVIEPLLPLYTSDARILVFYGGRGGGKTMGVAENMVYRIIQEVDGACTYLCMRETQTSLHDSTKAEIMYAIERMGLQSYFTTSPSSSRIVCTLNGCEFKFRGAQNEKDINKIKSMTNIKCAWIEECHALKEIVWEIFAPSVRGGKGGKSQIILTFNPMRKNDFIYNHFIVEGDSLAEVHKINYYDNPHFKNNEALIDQMKACRHDRPNAYRRIWLGEPGFVENQLINPDWWQYYDSFEEALNCCTGMYATADTACKEGQSHDYSVLQLWGYDGRDRLFCLRQWRGKWAFPTLVYNTVRFADEADRLHPIVKPHALYIEDKMSGIPLVQTLITKGVKAIPWKPKDYHFPEDKVGRANESALIICDGCVYLPKMASWVPGFVTECAEFTDDKEERGHDDQVDGLTMAISVWRRVAGGGVKRLLPKVA